MKKVKINKMAILVLFACIVTAFSFLKSSAVSSQKNEVRTNPNKEYQITYELNGGQFEGEYPKTFKISQETAIPNPIKDGSEFLGWTINDNINVAPVKDYKIPPMTQEDVKLTANWKSKYNMLVDGQTFNSKIKNFDNYLSTKALVFEKVNSIVDVKDKNNYIDVSEAQDESIIAYIDGSTLRVVSENGILANPNCSIMFRHMKYITNINFNNFNTSNVDNMSDMFYGCEYLTNIDLTNFNTSNVTDMNFMFNECYRLIEIKGIENFNTSNVDNMRNMFTHCNNLTSLDVSNFDTSKVTDMESMFANCNKLTEILGLEKWNTSQVIYMNYMFNNCLRLNSCITISNPDIINYVDIFNNCSTDTNAKFIVKYVSPETKEVARRMVDTKSYNSNVFLYDQHILLEGGMDRFSFSSKIFNTIWNNSISNIIFDEGIPNDIFNYPNVDVSEAGDDSIKAYIKGTTLYVASDGEILANQTSSFLLSDFSSIKSVTFNNFNTSNTENMDYMFRGCRELERVSGLETFNTKKVLDINYMFANCYKLKDLNVSKWDTNRLTQIIGVFDNCTSLENIDLSSWNTSKVTDMSYLFYDCKVLKNIIGLENFDTSRVGNMIAMFTNCYKLSGEITIKNPNLLQYNIMFKDCSTDLSAKFIVKYVSSETKEVANNLVKTKDNVNSNVFLYQQLNEDTLNNEEPSIPDTVVLTIKDGSNTTTKEIVAGEIGSLNIPSKEGMAFSGYFYDAEFTKPVSERDIISEDTTIYVKWEEVPQVEEIPQEENKDESLGEVA